MILAEERNVPYTRTRALVHNGSQRLAKGRCNVGRLRLRQEQGSIGEIGDYPVLIDSNVDRNIILYRCQPGELCP